MGKLKTLDEIIDAHSIKAVVEERASIVLPKVAGTWVETSPGSWEYLRPGDKGYELKDSNPTIELVSEKYLRNAINYTNAGGVKS